MASRSNKARASRRETAAAPAAARTEGSARIEYRFLAPHTHAGVRYAAGDRAHLTQAEADGINEYVGAGTVVAVCDA